MKRIAALWFFFMLANAVSAQVNEDEAIRKNFDSYLAAISQGKGEEAANQVDSRTINYYNDIAEMAKDADSLKVQSLPLLDKLMVLMVRHRVPKQDLLKMDGKALFTYAVNNKMVDAHRSSNLKLGTVTIEKDAAKGQLITLGAESPYHVNFYLEEGKWRYDLTSSFAVGMATLQKYVDEFGENIFIDWMLKFDKQNPPSPTIWRPVR